MSEQDDQEGGFQGQIRQFEIEAFLFAPAAKGEKNTLRLPLIPVACWRLDDVRFKFDSFFVKPETRKEFAGLALLRGMHPGSPLSIFGHADPTGNDDYNKQLSARRAAAMHGIVPRDVDLWEKLYSKPFGGDTWKTRFVQIGSGQNAVTSAVSIECEWDCGARPREISNDPPTPSRSRPATPHPPPRRLWSGPRPFPRIDPGIVERLKSQEPGMTEFRIQALSQIGDPAALEALLYLWDSHPPLRDRIRSAVRQISAEPPSPLPSARPAFFAITDGLALHRHFRPELLAPFPQSPHTATVLSLFGGNP